MNKELKELVGKLQQSVNWENWEDENGKHFLMGGVLWSKLEWIKEGLLHNQTDENEDDFDEYLTILNELQDFVSPILDELDKEFNENLS